MARGARAGHNSKLPLPKTAATLAAAAALLIGATAAPASAAGAANTVTVGLPPTAVAIDHTDHTAYVAMSDGVTDQVAIVDTALCTSSPSPTCSGAVTAVTLPNHPGPASLAYDPKNHTVYVADANTGGVSMIDAAACNATHPSGCAAIPRVASLGLIDPMAVAVDASRGVDAFYVADEGSFTVTVISGATCNATKSAGCSTVRTAKVGSAPSAIAVDHSVDTVYVANLGDDSVSTLKEAACSKLAAACKIVGRAVALGGGTSPIALAEDRVAKTLFVADSGTGDISFLDTSKCNITKTSGCSTRPPTHTGVADPEGVALLSSRRVAIAEAGGNAVLVFDASTCNAVKRVGCKTPEVDPLGGSPVGLAVSSSTIYAADATTSSLDVVGAPAISVRATSTHPKTKFGWYRSPVTVHFTCRMGTAALTSTCPKTVTLPRNGRHLVFRSVTSADGGHASVSLRLKIDKTRPSVKVKGVKSGKTYSSRPTLKCKAHDALSGVASCKIKRKHHGHVFRYIATARDKAGNINHAHGRYRVS